MTSTNDVAKQLIAGGPAMPLLVLTDQQTAGRGQQDRSWWAGQGALTFSWVQHFDMQPNIPILSLASAAAVADVLDTLDCSLGAQVKWPNDVYVSQKKIAGILIESVNTADGRLFIIGIGINANNSMKDAPDQIADRAKRR